MRARNQIFTWFIALAAAFVVRALPGEMATAATADDGIVRVASAYDVDETVRRLQADIAQKGIKFFMIVDQTQLGADAGIKLNPSKLLIFGNPPLGIQFLTANPNAGLDWPVRLLVTQDDAGRVWAVYSDFGWIARRHGITDREAQFKMASEVIASITSSVAPKH
ncbi:MAG: DUF302 domain-containing protein [Hyphomicrobium sp.]|uniref:DUF302 domain-containing protein n=1 Tax=Hyphomicrobium sp. TaxID=82 RepID=UPI001329BFD8|nr:DUF302 domain-containing protein [Hyphomicrobium sp.]KAB2940182.1 MAG: DUF302 domain-containing protein [Hyphomicrobium sp.]MBZ0210472.1 DUF302 domain-containing protein [Hyphomicrobium sp.]